MDQKIEKKDRKGDGYKSIASDLLEGEKYTPNALSEAFGFNSGAAATKDEDLQERQPYRGGRGGRGGRGRGGRGQHRDT